MVPFKTFPFLPPSEWIKTFFKQEQFLSLIKDRPEPSSTDYRDIWDGNVLQQFMVDSEDKERETLARRLNVLRVPYDLGRLPKNHAGKDVSTWFESSAMEEFHCLLCRGVSVEHCTLSTV